jgi:hypothetical protein
VLSPLKATHPLNQFLKFRPTCRAPWGRPLAKDSPGAYARGLFQELKARGWRATLRAAHLSPTGAHGALAVAVRGPGINLPKDMVPCIGLYYSTVHFQPMTYYAGAYLPQDDSAIVTASFRDRLWSTPLGVAPPREAAAYALDRWLPAVHELPKARRRLLGEEATPERVALYLIRAAREGRYPWSGLRGVDTFISQRCPDKRIRPRYCLWDVIVGFGRAVADHAPRYQMSQLLACWRLVHHRNTIDGGWSWFQS